MAVPVRQSHEAKEEATFQARPVTLAEAKDVLEQEQMLRANNLTYEQKLSLDHTTHFVRLPVDKARELYGKLVEMGVPPASAAKIVDIAPSHEDDIRTVFAKDRATPDAADLTKILEVVRSYS